MSRIDVEKSDDDREKRQRLTEVGVGISLLGILVLGETLHWNEPAGAALVLLGVLLSQGRRRAGPRSRPAPATSAGDPAAPPAPAAATRTPPTPG